MMNTVDREYPPLLFSINHANPAAHTPSELKTPGAPFSATKASTPRGGESSLSTARRSVATPGSAHTDATPSRPPPLSRLNDAEDAQPQPPPTNTLHAAAPAATPLSAPGASMLRPFTLAHTPMVLPVTPAVHTDSEWVTVFGFNQASLPLVLEEFQKCGEIMMWGTFGSPPTANFIHIKYTDKYSAQRALEKDHQQLSGGLIVGVKVLSAQHREDITQHVQGSPARQVRQPALPMRTYTINASAAQQLPRPGKGLLAKFSEFVIGI